MNTVVVEDPALVHGRLYELGLTEVILHDALRAGLGAAAACTDNHPPNFPGMAMWAETVCYLREVLIREGWTRSDARGFSTVVRGDGRVALTVARGDEVTGSTQDGAVPSTKHPKGAVTMEAVGRDQALLPFEHLPVDDIVDESAAVTWLLLHSRSSDRIDCELSLPTRINGSGYVEEWQERIILRPIDLDPTRMPVLDGEPVSPVIEVAPREAHG